VPAGVFVINQHYHYFSCVFADYYYDDYYVSIYYSGVGVGVWDLCRPGKFGLIIITMVIIAGIHYHYYHYC